MDWRVLERRTTRSMAIRKTAATLILVVATACTFASLTNPDRPVATIVVFPNFLALTPGQFHDFTVTGFTAEGDTVPVSVTWSASGGTVTQTGQYTAGAGLGRFTVVATLDLDARLSDSAVVTIEATLAPVASVSVTPTAATIDTGATIPLHVTLRDANGDTLAGRAVAWMSADEDIAFVGPSGVVRGISPGSVVITATSEGRSGASTITVSSGSSGPAIPDLLTWERRMLSGGDRFCTEPIPPPSPNCCAGEASVWYYDGIKVYYQIADYTGDARWKDCAERVVAVYRPWVFDPAPSLPYGFEVFSQGLRRHYEDTGQQISRDAVAELAFRSPFAHLNLGDNLRERAYMLEALIDEMALSGQKPTGYDNFVTESIAELERSVDHPQGQAFMVGLIAEAVIRHYEEVHPSDTRVLPAVRTAMDKLWDSCVARTRTPGRGSCGSWGPDVYQLVAPAFAWLYKMGLTQYAAQGDQLFADAAVNGFFSSGKQFSQLYHWSFDYVRWRR
jgi:Bacterial Ig-like domain (group 2)